MWLCNCRKNTQCQSTAFPFEDSFSNVPFVFHRPIFPPSRLLCERDVMYDVCDPTRFSHVHSRTSSTRCVPGGCRIRKPWNGESRRTGILIDCRATAMLKGKGLVCCEVSVEIQSVPLRLRLQSPAERVGLACQDCDGCSDWTCWSHDEVCHFWHVIEASVSRGTTAMRASTPGKRRRWAN